MLAHVDVNSAYVSFERVFRPDIDVVLALGVEIALR
jgi:hypothetical protein